MGKRGPTSRAAHPGIVAFWGADYSPQISRARASEILGAEVPEAAWCDVENAFQRFGYRKEQLKALKANNDPKDAQSYTRKRAAADRAINDAMKAIAALQSDHVLVSALNDNAEVWQSEQPAFQSAGSAERRQQLEFYDLAGHLEAAAKALMNALFIVTRADPQSFDVMSEAQARKALARDVRSALKPHDLPHSASDGWKLDAMDLPPSESDLSPFEQLISALGVYEAESPLALAKWIRGAIKEN